MAERFERYVDRSGECHRWTGAHDDHGYGTLNRKDGSARVHRIALELAGIEIPPGMTVDHVWARGCQFRDCVRVAHLEVVTVAENNRRRSAVITHCAQGHEFTPENTLRSRAGCRSCRICRNRRRNARRRALTAAKRAAREAA